MSPRTAKRRGARPACRRRRPEINDDADNSDDSLLNEVRSSNKKTLEKSNAETATKPSIRKKGTATLVRRPPQTASARSKAGTSISTSKSPSGSRKHSATDYSAQASTGASVQLSSPATGGHNKSSEPNSKSVFCRQQSRCLRSLYCDTFDQWRASLVLTA